MVAWDGPFLNLGCMADYANSAESDRPAICREILKVLLPEASHTPDAYCKPRAMGGRRTILLSGLFEHSFVFWNWVKETQMYWICPLKTVMAAISRF